MGAAPARIHVYATPTESSKQVAGEETHKPGHYTKTTLCMITIVPDKLMRYSTNKLRVESDPVQRRVDFCGCW